MWLGNLDERDSEHVWQLENNVSFFIQFRHNNFSCILLKLIRRTQTIELYFETLFAITQQISYKGFKGNLDEFEIPPPYWLLKTLSHFTLV